jgi:hypothetical protein
MMVVMIKEDCHENTKNPINMMIMTIRLGFTSCNNLYNMMIKEDRHESTKNPMIMIFMTVR